MFYFIRKKVVVDCFTNLPSIVDQFPLQRGLKTSPTWWKELAPSNSREIPPYGISRDVPTMKACRGFLDLYRNTWVLPLWTDLILKTYDSGAYQFLIPYQSNGEMITQHAPEDYGNNFGDFIHLKLISPWLMFEKLGIKFGYFGADWSTLKTEPDVRILSGILDFKNQHSSNINLFVPKKDKTYNFSAGMPLVHIFPMTERNVEFRAQYVPDEEYREIAKRTALIKTTFRFKPY